MLSDPTGMAVGQEPLAEEIRFNLLENIRFPTDPGPDAFCLVSLRKGAPMRPTWTQIRASPPRMKAVSATIKCHCRKSLKGL